MEQPFPGPLCCLESQVAGHHDKRAELQRLRRTSTDTVGLAGPPPLVELGLLLRSVEERMGTHVANRFEDLIVLHEASGRRLEFRLSKATRGVKTRVLAKYNGMEMVLARGRYYWASVHDRSLPQVCCRPPTIP